jgi:hypothetical protein
MMKKHELCDAQLKVWLPPSLFHKVELAAAGEGRSASGMARRVLEHWAATHDQPQATA